MLITNLTEFHYFLKNNDYPLPSSGALTVDDSVWESDDQLARTIESLDKNNIVFVSDHPDTYPRTTVFPDVINLVGGGSTPTLAQVLTEDNDAAGLPIENLGTFVNALKVILNSLSVNAGVLSASQNLLAGDDPTKCVLRVVGGPDAQEILNITLSTGEALLGVDFEGAMNLYPTGGATSGFSVDVTTGSGPDFGLLRVTNDGNHIFRVDRDGSVYVPDLPTSPPAGAGYLWNDQGTIKVTQ